MSRSIQYVHTSEEEKHADQFSFSVSDGTNEVNEAFNEPTNKKPQLGPTIAEPQRKVFMNLVVQFKL